MLNARRLLMPHALVLQMLFSRLQAARYRRPGVMFLIQHLVLLSARAYKTLRSVNNRVVDKFTHFLISVHMRWRERLGFLFCFSDSKHSRVLIWTHFVKVKCVRTCILLPIHGSQCGLSMNLQYLLRRLKLIPTGRWTYGANRVQIDADVKVLSEFLSYLQTDSVRASAVISSLSPAQTPSRSTCTCRSCFPVQ